jgi:hypothetical protein
MSNKTIGIFSYPWKDSYNARNPCELFAKTVWYKANPRNEDYMKALFLQGYPNGEFVNADSATDLAGIIRQAQAIVFLYPDSTGLGFERIETLVAQNAGKGIPVLVLNGRRRKFLLDRRARKDLRWRRLIEKFMLGEVIITVFFLAATPFLFLYDLIRGRK